MATVLVIGGGGREHAIAWKLAQSSCVAAVLVAKGNGGTASSSGAPYSKIRNLPQLGAAAADVIAACAAHAVSLVVVGPEDPLANGLADALRAAGIAVFGPDRAAAQIEVWLLPNCHFHLYRCSICFSRSIFIKHALIFCFYFH
jgi:phosphoribosylamine--glycine ligase